jgi:hypothetical protein
LPRLFDGLRILYCREDSRHGDHALGVRDEASLAGAKRQSEAARKRAEWRSVGGGVKSTLAPNLKTVKNMALTQKALQKKRAKKSEKRKEAKASQSKRLDMLGFAQEWTAAAQAPVADVFVPQGLFDLGIGTVWFSRLLPDGRYAMAGFVIDVYCLGVKNALYKIQTATEYAKSLEHIFSSTEEEFEREHPAYARKLVEKSLAYAKDLGFDPHPDYKIAKFIFGDVEANACPASFIFGKDGKPYYFCGPHESPAMQRHIVKKLEQRCGPGGFNFTLSISKHSDIPSILPR